MLLLHRCACTKLNHELCPSKARHRSVRCGDAAGALPGASLPPVPAVPEPPRPQGSSVWDTWHLSTAHPPSQASSHPKTAAGDAESDYNVGKAINCDPARVPFRSTILQAHLHLFRGTGSCAGTRRFQRPEEKPGKQGKTSCSW